MSAISARRLLGNLSPLSPSTVAPISTYLVPFLLQKRSASVLSDLADTPGSYQKRKRLGRGPSSGKGKTSGRGHKGQLAHGKVPAGFNGGQTPLLVIKGYRGYNNPHSLTMSPINLDRIQSWIDQGRIDPKKPITVKELVKSRCMHRVKDGLKLLGRDAHALRSPIKILVSQASASAIQAVEQAGGSVTTRYYTNKSIRQVLKGLSPSRAFEPANFDTKATNPDSPWTYRLPDPTSRRDIEYYRDPAHRGYLVGTVEEGEGPSLYFKLPSEDGKKVEVSPAKKAQDLNRLF
ncbi:MAG: YmL10 [Vezdaea aestivalis]|nr:MAG: YmL10 [Vezdaea aestivalis]